MWQGGTAAAPPQLNDRNLPDPGTYWNDTARCDYLIDLEFDHDPSPYGASAHLCLLRNTISSILCLFLASWPG